MTAQQAIDRLLEDQPKLYMLTEEGIRSAQPALDRVGIKLTPGPTSMAVPQGLIRYLATVVQDDHLTIETGAGHTTIAFAALARHHTCITPSATEVELIADYLKKLEIPASKVTFLIEPSDAALPKLSLSGKLDFAYVDGCHGYPFPALDWHYLDPHLKVGGLIGFDNTEIKAVQDHCAFLDANGSYRLAHTFFLPNDNYGACFYTKLQDQHREWIFQPYNYQRAPWGHPGARPAAPPARTALGVARHKILNILPSWTRKVLRAMRQKVSRD